MVIKKALFCLKVDAMTMPLAVFSSSKFEIPGYLQPGVEMQVIVEPAADDSESLDPVLSTLTSKV